MGELVLAGSGNPGRRPGFRLVLLRAASYYTCPVFEISTVIHVLIAHCSVSRDWIRGRDRMQLGAASRVTCSANEVLYPVK